MDDQVRASKELECLEREAICIHRLEECLMETTSEIVTLNLAQAVRPSVDWPLESSQAYPANLRAEIDGMTECLEGFAGIGTPSKYVALGVKCAR